MHWEAMPRTRSKPMSFEFRDPACDTSWIRLKGDFRNLHCTDMAVSTANCLSWCHEQSWWHGSVFWKAADSTAPVPVASLESWQSWLLTSGGYLHTRSSHCSFLMAAIGCSWCLLNFDSQCTKSLFSQKRYCSTQTQVEQSISYVAYSIAI